MRLKAVSFLLVLLSSGLAYGQDPALWKQYKAEFVSNDGRVIDRRQGLISHSEGQGYGLQLAVLYNDKLTFHKIWSWTQNNLKVRADNLFAWEWGKRLNGEWKVIDYNNATDGDILIAHALLEAGETWHDEGYKNEAIKTIRDIRTNLAINWQGHTFLLPGYRGFDNDDRIEVNPSYSILAAFRRFAQVDQRDFWERVYRDSLFLIEQSCFGKWCLPADWLTLRDGRISLSAGRNPYFGGEAIRILLYLSSEKKPHYPRGIGKILNMYKQIGYLPQWIDLEKDSFSFQEASAGYYAIYALSAKRLGDETLSARLMKEAREKLVEDKNAYYAFSLYLLALNAIEEQAH